MTDLCHLRHNGVMPVRTTIDIPEPLHNRLRVRAQQAGTSVRALIVRALEQTYSETRRGAYVTGPPVNGKGNGAIVPD